MKNVENAIEKNPFIRDYYGMSQGIIDSFFNDTFFNTYNELSHLKEFNYIIGILDHGDWSERPDLLSFVREDQLEQIKRKQCFFIFDASLEGWSPERSTCREYSIFDYLYASCETHNVDPEMIIYLTGNLEDENNMEKYSRKHGRKPFHVISFPIFERIVAHTEEGRDQATDKYYSASKLFEIAKRQCYHQFEDKLFSSLSRVNRRQRAIGTFLLCQHPVSHYALISHNKLDEPTWRQLVEWGETVGYSKKTIKRWSKTLPLIIDHSNFDVNWAENFAYGHIHDQTIFQVVNETESNNFNNTSMFLSEKTFKPILKCQPFVIHGQKGCNYKLKDLGYKLYDEWFDLSFDFEEDDVLRYKKMLASIEQTCKQLNKLSREEKIAWRFKNEEVLRHNCKVMQESAYSKNKLYQFLKNLKV